FSGSIPFGGFLPAWMYHAQLPPPSHVFNPNLPGITWVDLVFPFFLFAMGAAFPFALTKKLNSGIPKWKLFIQILQRGLMLALFAIFIQHTKPYALSQNPQSIHWITAIMAFALLLFLLTRFPNTISLKTKIIFKIVSAAAAVALLYPLTFSNGSGFSLNRSDIIILVLANTAFFGSLIWILTRSNIMLRVGILAFLLALRLTQNIEGSYNFWLWNYSPFPWLYKLYYLQYLFIVIPGTIAGDLIHKWIQVTEEQNLENKNKLGLIAFIMLSIVIVTVIGLFNRQIVSTLIFDSLLLTGAYIILLREDSNYFKLIKNLTSWGTYWLILGFFFEAFEGGIKKDKSTLSYYFITSGLAFFIYNMLTILIDRFEFSNKLRLLIANGQNPMIAYIAGSHILMPLFALTSLNIILQKIFFTPWLGVLKGATFTLLVALITAFFTNKKLFWRT
ncbi:MAG: DUF5009 domain-containing protein, partial [Ignavibacteria bacterium]|nr:DUF5009 domain-containing protein [Ignavibacteria bacterium]